MSIAKRILLIDDEVYMQQVIQICLESATSWQVSVAGSGQAGIAQAETEQPDAILLDAMMPDMDGLTTFARLQADPKTQQIPVILLSGMIQSGEHQKYEALGFKAVLVKPFEPFELAKQIAQSLGWSL
jgi:CheY-like chemotaxis protein